MAKHKIKSGFNKRKIATKNDCDVVLILTEGKNTEQIYFKELMQHLQLKTVHIVDVKQTTPYSVFEEAKKRYNKSKKEGNPYDRVYCVFDKDKHPKYQDTKNTIDNFQKPKNIYYHGFSEPCFEFWLLLHYIKTDKPFINFDELRKDKEFKKYLPRYHKSKIDFNDFKDRIPTACRNAKNNPHTNINELVEYLQNIKNKR